MEERKDEREEALWWREEGLKWKEEVLKLKEERLKLREEELKLKEEKVKEEEVKEEEVKEEKAKEEDEEVKVKEEKVKEDEEVKEEKVKEDREVKDEGERSEFERIALSSKEWKDELQKACRSDPEEDFVYILTSRDVMRNCFKVGRTNDPQRRLSEHRRCYPDGQFDILIRTSTERAEKLCHKFLELYFHPETHGCDRHPKVVNHKEWFKPRGDAPLSSVIPSLRQMLAWNSDVLNYVRNGSSESPLRVRPEFQEFLQSVSVSQPSDHLLPPLSNAASSGDAPSAPSAPRVSGGFHIPPTTKVFTTPTGEKFHKETHNIGHSRKYMTAQDAFSAGKTPCKVCF